MRTLSIAVAAIAMAVLATHAAAADRLKIHVGNASEREYIVEVRDMVCEGKVLFSGRMKPGTDATVRACAGEDGRAILAATTAAGCASAKVTLYEDVAAGDRISIAKAE